MLRYYDRKERAGFVAELGFSIFTVFAPGAGPAGVVARSLAQRLFDSTSYQGEVKYVQSLFHLAVRDGEFGFNALERLQVIDAMNLALTANGFSI